MKWKQRSKSELCSYLPAAVFGSSLMLLQLYKPVLADAIWALTSMESSDVTVSQGELQFVVDRGALIH